MVVTVHSYRIVFDRIDVTQCAHDFNKICEVEIDDHDLDDVVLYVKVPRESDDIVFRITDFASQRVHRYCACIYLPFCLYEFSSRNTIFPYPIFCDIRHGYECVIFVFVGSIKGCI